MGNVTKSPQGGRFYNMTFETIDQNVPEWWLGGKTMPSIDFGKFKNESPDNLYLNFYMNVNGKSLTQLYVTLFEEDGDVRFERKTFINGDFSGWKFVSLKLSDLRVLDVSKITMLDFSVNGVQPTTEAEVNLDFIIITKGAPFAQ